MLIFLSHPPWVANRAVSSFLSLAATACHPTPPDSLCLRPLQLPLAVCSAAYQCTVSSLSTSTISSSFPPRLAGQEASRAPGFLQGQQQATYVSCGWGSPQGSPGPKACVVPWVFHIRDPTATACPPTPPPGAHVHLLGFPMPGNDKLVGSMSRGQCGAHRAP